MRAATGAGAKLELLVLPAVFMNVNMIARVRGALVTANGVLETFEISSLRKLFRYFGFLFILKESCLVYLMYIQLTQELYLFKSFSNVYSCLGERFQKCTLYSKVECPFSRDSMVCKGFARDPPSF